jgi:hypothetical protein
MKIMKLLTDSSMNSVIESNAAFPDQISSRGSASNLAAPFVQILAERGNIAASNDADSSERPKARSEAAQLGLAVIAVIGAATLWGWALMQLCGLFLQAEPLLLRNTLPL